MLSTSPVTIRASSEIEACEKMFSHLSAYFDDGWTIKEAQILIDGWRNEYLLKKGEAEKLIKFDLKQSLQGINPDSIAFTIMCTTLSADKIQEFKKLKEGTYYNPPWPGLIPWLKSGARLLRETGPSIGDCLWCLFYFYILYRLLKYGFMKVFL